MQKIPDFLTRTKSKILRTVLYGDVFYSPFEIEILHTPLFQRLYGLKQLGFADKVFPDAVHSRFNHVLGVVERADIMLTSVCDWVEQKSESAPEHRFVFEVPDENDKGSIAKELTPEELLGYLHQRRPAIRLVALLHDLTHVAFGHTLEDEIHVFEESHDNPKRQQLFFDSLMAQLVWTWSNELGFPEVEGPGGFEELEQLLCLQFDRENIVTRAQWLYEQLNNPQRRRPQTMKESPVAVLSAHLKDLLFAFATLLSLDALHKFKLPPSEVKVSDLLAYEVLSAIDPEFQGTDFVLQRDAVIVDMIGNTICADLLDYAQRDSHFSGLVTGFDTRIIRYFGIASVRNFTEKGRDGEKEVHLCPTPQAYLRLAVQFYTNKIRLDVISGMSQILRIRYDITENVLLHPTKCAAGAMLGGAVQLLGFTQFPNRLLVLGDVEIVQALTETARALETLCLAVRASKEQFDSLEALLSHVWPHEPGSREVVAICLTEILRAPLAGRAVSASDVVHYVDTIQERAFAARRVLWNLSARRFPHSVYRLRSDTVIQDNDNIDVPVPVEAPNTVRTLATTYSNREARYELERYLEQRCALPLGAIVIHCPRPWPGMKWAQALVMGRDESKVRFLREVAALEDSWAAPGHAKELRPYEDEVRAIEAMYESIWRFHIFLDRAYLNKSLLVACEAAEKLHSQSDVSLLEDLAANSSPDNIFDLLHLKHFRQQVAWQDMPKVVAQVDNDYDRLCKRQFKQGINQPLTQEALEEIINTAIAAVKNGNSNGAETADGQKPLLGQRKKRREKKPSMSMDIPSELGVMSVEPPGPPVQAREGIDNGGRSVQQRSIDPETLNLDPETLNLDPSAEANTKPQALNDDASGQ